MTIEITPIYGFAVALIYLALWMRVTAYRASVGLSVGHSVNGGIDQSLLLRVRQHGNCAEWSGFLLILMMLAESIGSAPVFLHLSGALLLLGRAAHPFGLKIDHASHPLRYIGNGANLLASLILLGCLGIGILG